METTFTKSEIEEGFKQWHIHQSTDNQLMTDEEVNALSHEEYGERCAEYLIELMENNND